MPTDEWFKENPKISAYISKELNEKLTEWMQGRNVKKVSQALTTILEEYLGVAQNRPTTQDGESDRLSALEERVNTLFQKFQELEDSTQSSKPQVVQNEPNKVEGQLELLETEVNELSEPEQSEEGSSPVEENSSTLEKQEQLPNLMHTPKVVDFLGSTHNAVSRKHRRGEMIEEKGYRFTPEPKDKKGGKLNWKVEPL